MWSQDPEGPFGYGPALLHHNLNYVNTSCTRQTIPSAKSLLLKLALYVFRVQISVTKSLPGMDILHVTRREGVYDCARLVMVQVDGALAMGGGLD